MLINPFVFGDPLAPEQFIGRRREIRRIVNRIINHGQSTAVIGEPRSGKTSLLLYICSSEKITEIYGSEGKKLFFTYLDAHVLGDNCSQSQFWEYALEGFYRGLIKLDSNGNLVQAYQKCKKKMFSPSSVENLLTQMEDSDLRLAVLIDEFDRLPNHAVLCTSEFFGSLRSLATRKQSLALVIASRQPLTRLMEKTQDLSRETSPYFNFMDEVTLGALADDEIVELLERAEKRFSSSDLQFILEIAGGHPYLLQLASSLMWEAYIEGRSDSSERSIWISELINERVAIIIKDTWRLWTPFMRLAFTIVALPEITFEDRLFDESYLLKAMRDFGPELKILKRQGFIQEDTSSRSGWKIRPRAFLWWVSDELVCIVRNEISLREWLRSQEWEGLLKRGEKEKIEQIMQTLVDVLKNNADLIKSVVSKG